MLKENFFGSMRDEFQPLRASHNWHSQFFSASRSTLILGRRCCWLEPPRRLSAKMNSISTAALPGSSARADGASGVLAGLAEHLGQDLGGSIDDFRLAAEIAGRGDETRHLDRALDLIEAARQVLIEPGQGLKCAELRRVLRVVDRDIPVPPCQVGLISPSTKGTWPLT